MLVVAYSGHLSFRAKEIYNSRRVLGLSAFTVITKTVEFGIEFSSSLVYSFVVAIFSFNELFPTGM